MIDFSSISDEDLYEMCKRGDDGAWKYVYCYILKICTWNKWGLADPRELAQDSTMHLLVKAMAKVTHKEKFRNFITIMTRNKIKDSFKLVGPKITDSIDKPQTNNEGEDFVPEYPTYTPLQDAVVFDLETVAVIDSALKRLGGKCEKVLTAYFNFKIGNYEDYYELSAVLGMPIPTISSHVSRCLKKLVMFEEMQELRY